MTRSPTFTDFVLAAIVSTSALSSVVLPRTAHAQAAQSAQPSTGTNEERARAAFAEGLRLRDELRRSTQSLSKFAEAYGLAPTPLTGYELGKTHMALGQLLEAQRVFAAIGAMPPDPLQSAKGKAAREDAKRLVAELDTKIPSILVKLQGAPQDPPPLVSIDGKPIEASALAKPQRVNPGERTVKVAAGGTETSKIVTILDGRVETVTFEFVGGAPTATAGSGSFLPSRKTIALIVGGAGVIGVGVSLALGAIASGKNSSAREKHCGEVVGGANANQCDFQGYLDMKNAGRTADLATALFIVGGVAVGVGAVLWVTAPPAADAKRVALGVSPQGVLLQGGF